MAIEREGSRITERRKTGWGTRWGVCRMALCLGWCVGWCVGWGMVAPARLLAVQAVLLQDGFTSNAASQQGANFQGPPGNQALWVDGRPGGECRAWLQFDLAAVLPVGIHWTEVRRATLILFVQTLSAPGVVQVEAASGPWEERELSQLSAPPTIRDGAGRVFAGAAGFAVGRFVSLDVTELVRDWLGGALPNHGLVLVPGDESVRIAFDSKECVARGHAATLELMIGNAVTASPLWYKGRGRPDSAFGAEGDWFWDTEERALYGPKSAGGWGDPLGFRGSAGPMGIPGVPGREGAPGPPGRGWLSGGGSPPESLGQEGDFYLNRFSGTYYGPKTAWGWGPGFSLRGPSGPPGPPGPAGSEGPVGPRGGVGVPEYLEPMGDISMGRFTAGARP
ncbi:MAG: hypothetical protein RLZZ142_445 [Verrucomicrobiota bacterium]